MARKEEETPQEGNPADAGEGSEKGKEKGSSAPATAIEQAQKLHDQIKAENDRREALLEREEALHAEKMLGGHSDAGQAPPEKKELTPEEYKNKVMAGEVPDEKTAS